ncbi:MAG: GTPase domain-containing protein [Candidatus Hodarchaeales archaeon]|jgi:tRNA U34 5-carboxymethylaminomethyl modifying GTPase MnmE/TrmE
MVNVGILGDMDCGKTSVFVRFMNSLANSNEKILTGAPGGPEMYTTQTVDFIRFTHKGFIHVLYGTGGHTTPITDYYRVYVLRNANRFLCMFDLSVDLEQQLSFYENLDIPTKQLSIYLNKFDLAADNFSEYKEQIEDFFINQKKKLIKEILPTVAVKVEENEYKIETKNCIKGILDLCEFDKDASAFNVWDGQGR